MSSSASAKPHPLKDRWFVTYFPFVQQRAKSGKDFDEQQKPKVLDWVATAEELFSTINAFPHFTLLPIDDNLVFARNNVDPYYENFPDGMRLCIYTRTKTQGDAALALVLASVMGENLRSVVGEDNVAEVVRIAHKLSNLYPEAMRIEILFKGNQMSEEIQNYFSGLFKIHPGIRVACFPITSDGEAKQ
ncbi:putative Eukaryotic initiation factor 4E [Trypanosoma vivax]|uniref:Uncharacterized protein n=1 Tax=Trypanosoma vivax (strain Y486) TaxID=1055687 RepID=G0TXX0_TRYVY|nr:putative Eukaryotic initiation factor 4E [Trypanosoma vivax]KAH8610193.1 putative Eukaryotic initiation factor 4E [Trypanosoma vivax]CCC48813.1 conserved hypothetical protein [Trypanosoma vivax Y486]